MHERPREPSAPDVATAPEATEPPERRGEPDAESVAVDRSPQNEGMGREDRLGAERSEQLLSSDEAEGYRRRWEGVQTAFVDHPQRSVEEADKLVAEVLKRVAEIFSSGREILEATWERDEDVSTEDLRRVLQRYRSFFNRLLSA
jgi:hypothetical protein